MVFEILAWFPGSSSGTGLPPFHAVPIEHTIPLIMQWDENFDIGADTGTPVDDRDYQVPFRFTGKLNKPTLSIDRPKLTPEEEKKLMETQAMASDHK